MTNVQREALAQSLRALADQVVRTGASDETLAMVTAHVDTARAELDAVPPGRSVPDTPHHGYALVGGRLHPFAPQVVFTVADGGATGTVTLGPSFEGGPGLVHGGVLALLLDHALGVAVFHAGFAAMTRTLTVRFDAPTTLAGELTLQSRVARVDGRALHVEGSISQNGRQTVHASGVFMQLTEENVRSIFVDRLPPIPPGAPSLAPTATEA